MPSNDTPLERETYTVPQAGQILGLSSEATYDAVRAGQIPVLRFSRKTLRISRRVIERMLDGRDYA
jgi:excisionase family DNA binding protein